MNQQMFHYLGFQAVGQVMDPLLLFIACRFNNNIYTNYINISTYIQMKKNTQKQSKEYNKIVNKKMTDLQITVNDPTIFNSNTRTITRQINKNKQDQTKQAKQAKLHKKQEQKQKKSMKQLAIRQKHQIFQMQNQIQKIDNAINAEKLILRNKMMMQQLDHELKKNQIAARMSKKQIILKRLSLLAQGNQQTNNHKHNVKQIKNQTDIHNDYHKADKNNLENTNDKNRTECQTITSQKTKVKTQKHENNNRNKSLSYHNAQRWKPVTQIVKIQNLRQLVNKKKQYGNRVQKQYHKSRSSSALCYMYGRNEQQAQRYKNQIQQQRNRIIRQLIKPKIPIIKNAEQSRISEIDKIRQSTLSCENKLVKLNYLSRIQLNRLNIHQYKQSSKMQNNQQEMQVLRHLNSARTQILLNQW